MASASDSTFIDHDAAESVAAAIQRHQRVLAACRLCDGMMPPVVMGRPVVSSVLLVGQAPGAREGPAGRPFAWTAGKTLFKWFAPLGLGEDKFRSKVYMSAVCRCFPGKNPKGGDRVPSPVEIETCGRWLEAELALLRPALVVPVGKLAISRFMPVGALKDVIGRVHRVAACGQETDVIPLPHPSGASTWHRTDPGKALLADALALIGRHPAWRNLL